MKKILSIIAVITVLGILAVPALADYKGEDFKAKVISDSACVYEKAKTKSDVLGVLNKGAVVTVIGARGNWAKVERKGRTGYMKISDLMSDGPCMIVMTKDVTPVFMIKGGKGWKLVSAGTTLNVVGKDGSGHYLVANKSMTKLGYIDKNLVFC